MMRKGDTTRRAFVLGATAGILAASTSSAVLGATPGDDLRFPLRGRGGRVPPGLIGRMRAQNAVAADLDNLLRSDAQFMRTLTNKRSRLYAPVETLPATFDWRAADGVSRVTPVKDQGVCGSCWSFAAVAAFESAYLIAYNLPGADAQGRPTIRASEQQLLDCVTQEDDCVVGGWHEDALMYLRTHGGARGDVSGGYPYRQIKTFCTSSHLERPFWALNLGYVANPTPSNPSAMPTDRELKTAIYRYGPVAAALSTGDWGTYWKRYADGTPVPDWEKKFPNGIFEGVPNANLTVNDVSHEVAIVGWDDREGVWFIRNSWGTDWGEEGYMKLKYGRNLAGFGASWVTVSPPNAISPAVLKQFPAPNDAR